MHFASKHNFFVGSRLLSSIECEIKMLHQPTKKTASGIQQASVRILLCKHKYLLYATEHLIEFAQLADPDSEVFTNLSVNRCTVTQQIEETTDYILRGELSPSIGKSPFWSFTCCSLDKSIHEQSTLMVRYIDFSQYEIVTRYKGIVCLTGTPNDTSIIKYVRVLILLTVN